MATQAWLIVRHFVMRSVHELAEGDAARAAPGATQGDAAAAAAAAAEALTTARFFFTLRRVWGNVM